MVLLAGLTAFTMPYFINPTQLAWGAKVGYVWAGSNAVTFGESSLSVIQPPLPLIT